MIFYSNAISVIFGINSIEHFFLTLSIWLKTSFIYFHKFFICISVHFNRSSFTWCYFVLFDLETNFRWTVFHILRLRYYSFIYIFDLLPAYCLYTIYFLSLSLIFFSFAIFTIFISIVCSFHTCITAKTIIMSSCEQNTTSQFSFSFLFICQNVNVFMFECFFLRLDIGGGGVKGNNLKIHFTDRKFHLI